MVSLINSSNTSFDHAAYVEYAGLSTDTKPVGNFMTGSIFVEVNTGKVFFYNAAAAAGSEWVEQFSFQ